MLKGQFNNVDADYIGNATRFINHMNQSYSNVRVFPTIVKEQEIILFYAQKLIKKGEELFFDYGDSFKLDWKSDFDKLTKKQEKFWIEKLPGMMKYKKK